MYSFDSRVRYSEVNQNLYMDLSSITNYFQDCSCFHSEACGVGLEYLTRHHRAWLLSSWQIIIYRYPMFGEQITTGTWAYDFDKLYAYRNYIMKDHKNQVCAVANSLWINVNTKTGHPEKITQDTVKGYTIEPKYDTMPYAQRKIILPTDFVMQDPFAVLPSHIDTNKHVNNGQYVQMAQAYLPTDFKIYQMRAEYKRQAVLGDIIYPKINISDTTCTVSLTNQNNQPYTILEFQKDTI